MFGMGPSEIACFLSHRKIWEMVILQQIPWAFVAEDDIYISESLPQFLQNQHWMPANADIIKAETAKQRVWLEPRSYGQHRQHQLYRLRSFHGGSAGYFVSLQAATKLLERSEHCLVSPDQALFNSRFSICQGLKIYQIDPALVAQDWVHVAKSNQPHFQSLLLADRHQYHARQLSRNRSFFGLISYKLSNPIKKAVRRSVESAVNCLGTYQVRKIGFSCSSTQQPQPSGGNWRRAS
jgi:glycosyl transferase family 25